MLLINCKPDCFPGFAAAVANWTSPKESAKATEPTVEKKRKVRMTGKTEKEQETADELA